MSSSTTAAARSLVYSSYRRLYRARVALFRGDDVAMRESRVEVRNQYLSHGTLPIVDASHWQGLIDMADEAASMLRHSIVQSKLNETTGHYGTYKNNSGTMIHDSSRSEPEFVVRIGR